MAVLTALAIFAMAADATAQTRSRTRTNDDFRTSGYIPDTFQPPREFATSREHYDYLLDQYRGGVTHTWDSVPKWDGIWSAARNNSANQIFLSDGEIVKGILTPEYEDAFRYRRDLGVDYDRLTTCEPAGMPRWLLEPYTREFVNTPTQSWWMNDLGNDTRRIYINQEHQNIDGTHYASGDSIGFWAEDDELGEVLVVHTIDVYPGDWFRGTPPTSNQFETTEIWYRYWDPEQNQRRIAVNVTFYDELALLKPVTATYTFRPRRELEEVGYRIRHWECESNDNTFLTFNEDGTPSTQYALPGEEGFVDPRGVDRRRNPDLPPDLAGQEKNPIFDDGLPVFDFGE
ncbi:MAG: hypothetical protein PVF50_07275 [Gammaproteobacteria bacterium]